MAKKKGDIKITVPSADLSLKDLPVKQKSFEDAQETWMTTRDREAARRAERQYLLLKAKKDGLAAVNHLWKRPPIPEKAVPKIKYKTRDLALRPTLVEFMADYDIKLKTAVQMAEDQGRVAGLGTPGNKVERVARNLKDYRKDMEKEAQTRRNKRH